jgi:3-hydroxyisobutyrate dehydrogenase-like beta-hydroxyacid dehydrogenase
MVISDRHTEGALVDRIAVLGLGAMGLPIARRLSATYSVTGFDSDPERRATASRAGFRLAASPEDLARDADILITVLPGAASQRRALSPDAGSELFAAMRTGTLVVDMTSGDPRLSRELAAAAAHAGVGYVSAPMSGDPGAAFAGRLGLYLSGPSDLLDRTQEVLGILAEPPHIKRLGDDPGAAQTMKLIVNSLWFGHAAMMTEMLLLAARDGIPAADAVRVIDASPASSAFTSEYLPRLLHGDYVPTFGIDLIVDQLETTLQYADDHAVPADLLRRVRDLHARALSAYGPVRGELLVAKLLESEAGLTLHEGAYREDASRSIVED